MGLTSSNNNQKVKVLEHSIYKNIGMNEYICKLDINIPNTNPPEFIFIVDKSGSIGSTFNYIINKTIPKVLNSLGYGNKKIHLITFDNDVQYLNISQSELKDFNCNSGGNTYMSKSFELLEKKFYISKEKCNNLRILTITDGMLHDQNDTKKKGELLFKKYKNVFKINSQCIRLYTGSEVPDTSGIISTLKFNNVKCCDLINHDKKELESLANKIIKLFKDDGLIKSNLKIIGENVCLKDFPWEETTSNILPLKNGKNIFFYNENKPLHIYIHNKYSFSLKCKNEKEINNSNYKSIVGQGKILDIFQRFAVNKTLNTNESKKENMFIIKYFDNLYEKTKRVNNDKILKFLKEKLLILNEQNINNLDEEIKALYINQINEEEIDYEQYGRNYNENDFWSKIKKVGKKIGIKPLYYAFLLYYALPNASVLDKITIIGCLGYFISPLDLIPDVIPVVGLMDDAGVLALAVYRLSSKIDNQVKEKAKTKIKEIFNSVSDEELEQILK